MGMMNYWGSFMNRNAIRLTRRIAGIILLICLFLPLSQCERSVPAKDGKALTKVELAQMSEEEINELPRIETLEVSYALSDFDVKKLDSWFILFSFIWPLVIWLISLPVKKPRSQQLIYVAEFCLCFYSAYFIYVAIILEEPLFGWYLSISAIVGYLITLLILFALFIKDKRKG